MSKINYYHDSIICSRSQYSSEILINLTIYLESKNVFIDFKHYTRKKSCILSILHDLHRNDKTSDNL